MIFFSLKGKFTSYLKSAYFNNVEKSGSLNSKKLYYLYKETKQIYF